MKKMKHRRGLTKKQRKLKKFKQLKNKRLIKKYYWLAPRNVWTGRIPKDYDYTWIDWGWGQGWDKAFGQMYMDELGSAIKESGDKHFRILQIKEKYGSARNYTTGCTRKVHEIIEKYEHISCHICYYCGKEAPMTDDGWMLPRCYDCFVRVYRKNEKWFQERGSSSVTPKTDEELQEMYQKMIADEPDENGEYHLPTSYTYRTLKNGEWEDVTVDISDTVKKLQKRISKWTG